MKKSNFTLLMVIIVASFDTTVFAVYPTNKGDILVTTDPLLKILPIGHVALVQDKNYIIEATINGVVRSRNNWNKKKKKVYGLRVNSVSKNDLNKVYEYIKKQMNKKYNFNYSNTKIRSKFYCSQLVWAGFLEELNINLDTYVLGKSTKTKNGIIHPIELVKSNYTKIIYKK